MTYPHSRIPPRAVLSFRRKAADSDVLPSVLDAGTALLLTSGRVSLAMALVDIGVTSGDSVLMPAFNCPAMLEPVSWCGAKNIYYKVRPDLTVDMEDLMSKADATTRVVVVVHYFGFPQHLRALRAFCDARNIRLVEDCAHACFGKFEGRPPGSVGDYAIASLMKFYPIYDGGCLVSSRHKVEFPLRSGDARFQLKSALNLVEESIRYGRLRPLNWLLILPLIFKDWVWAQTKKRLPLKNVEALGPEAADGGYTFNSKWMNIGASWISQAVIRRTSVSTLIARRRNNYRRFAAALKDVPGCRALFPELPDTVVPYVFPLLVDSPATVFPRLKDAGVPLYRWEVIAQNVCDTTTLYASHLLQIPCHQELCESELRWMVETIVETVTATAAKQGSDVALSAQHA